MAKENLGAVYPNPIEKSPEIGVVGDVPRDAVETIKSATEFQIEAVHTHYSRCGVIPSQQLSPSVLKVDLFDKESYRSNGNGANTWRYNYVLGTSDASGILVNAAVLQELPEECGILLNHEIRHIYIARIVGNDVFASSFPLREGSAGLPIDSTERLRAVLEQRNDELYLPLSITYWDRQLDEEDTNRRCYINNPWYLSLFSFFHDYIGVKHDGLSRLIQVYPAVQGFNGDLSRAWQKTFPDQPTLGSSQESWLEDGDLKRFRIKE